MKTIRLTGVLPQELVQAQLVAPFEIVVTINGHPVAAGRAQSIRFVEDGVEYSFPTARPPATTIPSNGIPRQIK